MDRKSKKGLGRTLIVLCVVFGLLQSIRTTDVLSSLTKPVVISTLSVLGVDATDYGDYLLVSSLKVPWTRDCSGFDVLLLLWALILWTTRESRLTKAFFLRFLAAIPAAVLANGARVLTIVAWRHFFFPAVESPQLHYFFGFLWLLPLLFLFVPRASMPTGRYIVEMCYFAAVLSLAASQATGPGGVWVTACSLLLFAEHGWRKLESVFDWGWAILWTASAAGIGLTGMESLWLPWLLLCPWFASRRLLLSPAVLLVPGTIPIIALEVPVLIALGAIWACWLLLNSHVHIQLPLADRAISILRRATRGRYRLRERAKGGQIGHIAPLARSGETALTKPIAVFLLIMTMLPFVVSSAGSILQVKKPPPVGLMVRMLEPGGYSLQLVGQSADIGLAWYSASGSGRHHTLPVCMQYRGVKLRASDEMGSRVLTDEKHWMAEIFLLSDGTLVGHRDYLRKTFLPFSDPGVHLIATASRLSMPAGRFYHSTQNLFCRVAEMNQGKNISDESAGNRASQQQQFHSK